LKLEAGSLNWFNKIFRFVWFKHALISAQGKLIVAAATNTADTTFFIVVQIYHHALTDKWRDIKPLHRKSIMDFASVCGSSALLRFFFFRLDISKDFSSFPVYLPCCATVIRRYTIIVVIITIVCQIRFF